MLEIILLFALGKHIAKIAKKKNRNPVGYVLLLVFGWFILAIGGGIVGIVIGGAAGGTDDDFILYMLPGYLLGAAGAVGLAYLVVGMVAPLPKRRFDDEYDDYDDERPRRPLRVEDDEDDDRPRARWRYEDDEDEDDRPRRRREP